MMIYDGQGTTYKEHRYRGSTHIEHVCESSKIRHEVCHTAQCRARMSAKEWSRPEGHCSIE